jgi:hypothetical protein
MVGMNALLVLSTPHHQPRLRRLSDQLLPRVADAELSREGLNVYRGGHLLLNECF